MKEFVGVSSGLDKADHYRFVRAQKMKNKGGGFQGRDSPTVLANHFSCTHEETNEQKY